MAPDADRIVITGLGVVSPVGAGKQAFWTALNEGRSGVRPVTLFRPDGDARLAGEISDFDAAAILGPGGLRLFDRATKLALCASKLALADAGLESMPPPPDDIGVALGTTMGSPASRAAFSEQALRDGLRSVNPALFPNTVISSPASQVAIRFALRAFAVSIATGATSSLAAIDYAARMLRERRATIAVAGGVEELSLRTFVAFDSLGLLSRTTGDRPEQAAPFDRRRDGTVMGEGAAMVVMESLAGAKSRGATCLGEYLGGARAADRHAHRRGGGRTGRAVGVLSQALGQAEIEAREIDCVAAGASGSPAGDRLEAQALDIALGRRRPDVFAVTSIVGDSFSASGALQIAAALGAIAEGSIPPTPTCQDIDPACRVTCAAGARRRAIRRVLISSIGPQGYAAGAVIGEMRDPA